jgi:hypothetical protein
VRVLTERCKAGTEDSFEAYQELANLLFRLTVLRHDGGLRLSRRTEGRDRPALGGWKGPTDPLPLTDGNLLRLSASLFIDETLDGPRMKVRNSSYQYQLDNDGKDWVFRYDYLRTPKQAEPPAHLQLHGKLVVGDRSLDRLRFPTGRVTLEAVIRLLAEQFAVPTNQPPEVWRPLLAASESLFLKIAHQPLSGPET